jgi:hypothetical protein
MTEQDKNEALMNAVASYKVKAVRTLLKDGANPNYVCAVDGSGIDDYRQPRTPLQMVIFRISDCMLENKHLNNFCIIAKLLLQYGADPKPAMRLAEYRYGKYDSNAEKSAFMQVLNIVAKAIKE